MKVEELLERAEAVACAAVAPAVGCPVSPQRMASEVEWDGDLRRHIFHATIEAWAQHDTLTVLVDAAGNILSFHDARRFEITGAGPYPALTEKELLTIASTTGKLGPRARVIAHHEARPGLSKVVVLDGRSTGELAWMFTINLTTRKVAAFEKWEDES